MKCLTWSLTCGGLFKACLLRLSPQSMAQALWDSPANPLNRQRNHMSEMVNQAHEAVAQTQAPGAAHIKPRVLGREEVLFWGLAPGFALWSTGKKKTQLY